MTSEIDIYVPYGLSRVHAIRMMQDALESLAQWEISERAAEGSTMHAISEAYGYVGSSTNLKRRFPDIDKIVATRHRVQETRESAEVEISGYTAILEPMELIPEAKFLEMEGLDGTVETPPEL